MLNKLFLLILGTSFLLCPLKVIGQSSEGYAIIPPFTNIEINDGEKQKEIEIQIKNNTKVVTTFDLSVVDFGTLDESGGVAFLTTTQDSNVRKYALASWVNLEKDTLVIGPGKIEKLKITILNKDSLSSGGHYGAVMATLRHESKVSGSIVGVNQILATLMYVQKTGGEKKVLSINNVDVSNNFWKLSENIILRLENSGNTHLVPRGYVSIQSSTGKMVAKGIINSESSIIIPESFRKYNIAITRFSKWLWPGKYNLLVDYRYDGKSDFENHKLPIIYFGKEGLVLGIILLVLITFIFWKLMRKNRK